MTYHNYGKGLCNQHSLSSLQSMLGTLLLPSRGLKLNKSAIVKSWNDYLKTYKKTGIRLRQAIITAPNGEIMSQDGENALTKADLMVSVALSETANSHWQKEKLGFLRLKSGLLA